MVSLSPHASDAIKAPELTPAERTTIAANDLGLTMTAVFVPFSQSRNAKARDGADKPWRSLNWSITLERAGRPFLTTDYSQGEGHAPSANASKSALARAHYTERQARHMAITYEIETGRKAVWSFGKLSKGAGKPIDPPAIADVLYSLVADSSVLDAGTFENWAAEFGYDTDSRTAEATYRACLEIALQMRAAIGEAGLEKLRVALEDF